MDRRTFLAAAGVAAKAGEVAHPKVWIDPRLAALPSRPWRKVHLDFHNSEHIPRIGEKLDAEEFGNRLAPPSGAGVGVRVSRIPIDEVLCFEAG